MPNKKNPWLKYLLILGGLLGVLVLKLLMDRKYERDPQPVFSAELEKVTLVTITKDTSNVTLKKLHDTLWVFVEPDSGEVRKYRIENFFKYVLTASYGEQT